MGPFPPLGLSELTHGRLEGLSPQLRRAASYIVENPGDVATRSQRYVAEAAGLPPPTFTRLAKAIGLHSYDELRELCRRELLPTRTRLADRARSIEEVDETQNPPLIAQHTQAMVRNMQYLVDRMDSEKLNMAARILANARRVVLIAEMSARGIGDYVTYVSNISLLGWKALGRSGEGLSSEIAALGPQDACIVTSISPYSARSVEMAQHVADRGCTLICLTDNTMSPLAAISDHSFFVGTDGPFFFPSHAPSTLVFETLLDLVFREMGPEAQRHIAAVEQQNHKLNEYWRERYTRED